MDTDNVAQRFTGLGRFDLGAAQQLLLFVFLVFRPGGLFAPAAGRD